MIYNNGQQEGKTFYYFFNPMFPGQCCHSTQSETDRTDIKLIGLFNGYLAGTLNDFVTPAFGHAKFPHLLGGKKVFIDMMLLGALLNS